MKRWVVRSLLSLLLISLFLWNFQLYQEQLIQDGYLSILTSVRPGMTRQEVDANLKYEFSASPIDRGWLSKDNICTPNNCDYFERSKSPKGYIFCWKGVSIYVPVGGYVVIYDSFDIGRKPFFGIPIFGRLCDFMVAYNKYNRVETVAFGNSY